MRVLFVQILFCILANYGFSQEEPLDTIYNKYNRIDHITFLKDSLLSGYPVDCYFNYSDEKNAYRKIIDTVFYSIYKKDYHIIRNYLEDSIVLQRRYQRLKNNQGIPRLQGLRVSNVLNDSLTLFVQIWYHPDNSLSAVMIGSEFPGLNKEKKYHSDLRFKEGSVVDRSLEVDLHELGSCKILFNDNNLVTNFFFLTYYNDIERVLQIDFDNKANVEEYGLVTEFGRIGAWNFYHSNGRVSSRGNFNGSKLKSSSLDNGYENEFIHLKDGVWEYFDKNGFLVKKEHWENGKLQSK